MSRRITDVSSELLETIKRLESRVEKMVDIQAAQDILGDHADAEREELLQFVRDVWLNKYPTKPRVIAAAGRLLDKLGER